MRVKGEPAPLQQSNMAAEARTSLWLLPPPHTPLSPWGVCLGPHQWSWQLGKLTITEWVIRTSLGAPGAMWQGRGREKPFQFQGEEGSV